MIETTAVPSRRERKKIATRKHIEQTAKALFKAHGFDNVTVLQIAEAADVDVTTVWRHFRSKLSILYAEQEEWLFAFRDMLAKVPPELTLAQAAVNAVMNMPPIGDPAILDLIDELREREPSPEIKSAILAVEDMARRELADALAERNGVPIAEDPKPAIIAAATIAASGWFREYHALAPGFDMAEAPALFAKVLKVALEPFDN
jgi:AcrR family transcriptional regulator